MKLHRSLGSVVIVLIAVSLYQCEARTVRRLRVIAAAEGEQDVQSVNSTQTLPSSSSSSSSPTENKDEGSQDGNSVAPVARLDTNRSARSKQVPEQISCTSSMQVHPIKKVDTVQRRTVQAHVEEAKPKSLEGESGTGEPIRKIRRIYKTRRIVQKQPEAVEVEGKHINAEPVKALEVEPKAPALEPEASSGKNASDGGDRKQRRSNLKRKLKKNSSTTTTSTTTAAPEEEFSEEANEDDLGNSSIFPKQHNDNMSHEENKNSKPAEEPAAKAISSNSESVKPTDKDSVPATAGASDGDGASPDEQKPAEGEAPPSRNSSKKNRKTYQGRRIVAVQGSETSRPSKRRSSTAEEEDSS